MNNITDMCVLQKNDSLPEPDRYDRDILETLVWVHQMRPDEIVRHYNGRFSVNLALVMRDMLRYHITPKFVEGYDIIDDLKKSIKDYDDTIGKYTQDKQASYRKLDKVKESLVQVRDFVSLAMERSKSKSARNETVKELSGLRTVLENLESGLTIKEMVNIQQGDEEIRIKYYKLRQEERKLLMKAVDTQMKALETDAILTATYEELAIYDKLHNTNFALNFMLNVRGKVIKKLSSDRLLDTRELYAKEEIRVAKVKKEKKARKIRGGLSAFADNCRTIMEAYQINYNVAQSALGLYRRSKDPETGNETATLSECIDVAKKKDDGRLEKLRNRKKRISSEIPTLEQIKNNLIGINGNN